MDYRHGRITGVVTVAVLDGGLSRRAIIYT